LSGTSAQIRVYLFDFTQTPTVISTSALTDEVTQLVNTNSNLESVIENLESVISAETTSNNNLASVNSQLVTSNTNLETVIAALDNQLVQLLDMSQSIAQIQSNTPVIASHAAILAIPTYGAFDATYSFNAPASGKAWYFCGGYIQGAYLAATSASESEVTLALALATLLQTHAYFPAAATASVLSQMLANVSLTQPVYLTSSSGVLTFASTATLSKGQLYCVAYLAQF
jgi:hypothetical protein